MCRPPLDFPIKQPGAPRRRPRSGGGWVCKTHPPGLLRGYLSVRHYGAYAKHPVRTPASRCRHDLGRRRRLDHLHRQDEALRRTPHADRAGDRGGARRPCRQEAAVPPRRVRRMDDPYYEGWLPGTFVNAPAFGSGGRLVVDETAIVLWPADALGSPDNFNSLGLAALIRSVVLIVLVEEEIPQPILPSLLWMPEGFRRVVPWNGGASD